MKPEMRWHEGDGSLYWGDAAVGFVHCLSDGWVCYSRITRETHTAPENTRESAMAYLMERTKQMLREAGE